MNSKEGSFSNGLCTFLNNSSTPKAKSAHRSGSSPSNSTHSTDPVYTAISDSALDAPSKAQKEHHLVEPPSVICYSFCWPERRDFR